MSEPQIEPWMRSAAKVIASINPSDLWMGYYRKALESGGEGTANRRANERVWEHFACIIAEHAADAKARVGEKWEGT